MLSHGRSERVSSIHPGRPATGSTRRRPTTCRPPRAGRPEPRRVGLPLPRRRRRGPIRAQPSSSRHGPVSTTPHRRRTSTEPGRMTGPAQTISRLISGSRRNADGVPRALAAGRLLRQAEVDEVAEVVGGEAELEADRALARRALHGVAAVAGAAEGRRAGPQRGLESTLAGERADDVAAAAAGEQPKGPVEARLAAAVRARDDVEPVQGHDDLAQRAVAGHGDGGEHAPTVGRRTDRRGAVGSVDGTGPRRDAGGRPQGGCEQDRAEVRRIPGGPR